MQRHDALLVIIQAATWLTASPLTHEGRQVERSYQVKESAHTRDYVPDMQGVYLGHTDFYGPGGKWQGSESIMVVDHGDPASFGDHIPVTHYLAKDDIPLWHSESRVGIDMRVLAGFSEEQLVRMAVNINRVLADYNVDGAI